MTLQCSSLCPYIEHLPEKPATYIVSQTGLIHIFGSTENLQEAILKLRDRELKGGKPKILFDNLSIVHYFDHSDLSFAKYLQSRCSKNYIKRIETLIDCLPSWLKTYYKARIKELIKAIPDDAPASQTLPYIERVVAYYRVFYHNHRDPQIQAEYGQWFNKANTIRWLANATQAQNQNEKQTLSIG